MPLSSSLLTLMKLSFNGSNYNNHSNNASTTSNTSSSSSAQPFNRIFRREITSQTRQLTTPFRTEEVVSSEKGPRIALIKPTFTAKHTQMDFINSISFTIAHQLAKILLQI